MINNFFFSETNECLSSPCLNGGICIDQLDSYECNCSSSFIGLTCETGIIFALHCL